MKHPDAPIFPLHRQYRIVSKPTAGHVLYRVEFKTWLTRRWKCCSSYFHSHTDAVNHQLAVRIGLADWRPV